MKEDNIKSKEKSNKDLKEDEKYKNLPEFIKSMIENLSFHRTLIKKHQKFLIIQIQIK